jgi:DNA-directed RNA polymerase specialized sigma24 family protein
MEYRSKELNSLFRKFKDGDSDALDIIISDERERLFDFLMRMTGQVAKSTEVLQEAINAVLPVADQEDNLHEFLVVFYRTARSFSIEAWNADTSRLENSSYSVNEIGTSEKIKEELLDCERVVRSLPGMQREVVFLHLRLGFSVEEVSDITSYTEDDVREYLDQAQGIIAVALNVPMEKLKQTLYKLKFFAIPNDEYDGTQNLSLVVRDLKRSSRSTPGGLFRLLPGLMLLILVIYVIINRMVLFEYLEAIFSP